MGESYRERREVQWARAAYRGWHESTAVMYSWATLPLMDGVEPSAELREWLRKSWSSFKQQHDEDGKSMSELEAMCYEFLHRGVDKANQARDVEYARAWSKALSGVDIERAEEAPVVPKQRLVAWGRDVGKLGVF